MNQFSHTAALASDNLTLGLQQLSTSQNLHELLDDELQALERHYRELANSIHDILKSREIADRKAYDACFISADGRTPGQIAKWEELVAKDKARRIGFAVVLRFEGAVVRYIEQETISSYEWNNPDEERPTYPKLWWTYDRALRYANGLKTHGRSDLRREDAEVALWAHPEATWGYRSRYLLMEREFHDASPTA